MKSTYANRGMILERYIELTNAQYKRDNIAVVQKVATPVKVLHRANNGKITGFYEAKSTVDFIGCYDGGFIAFDAKETKGKSFPLKNVHEHQLEYMDEVIRHGGKAFIVVYFSELDKYFVMTARTLIEYTRGTLAKSIPITYFEKHAREIRMNDNSFVLDYLGIGAKNNG